MSPELPPKASTPDVSSTPSKISTPPPMSPLPPSVTSSRPKGHPVESSPLLQAAPRSSNLSPSPFPENDDEFDGLSMPHRSSLYLIGLTFVNGRDSNFLVC